MPEFLLFDLFGVLAHNQYPEKRRRVMAAAGVTAAAGVFEAEHAGAETAFWDAYWRERPPYDRGVISGFDYWRRIRRGTGVEFGDERIADIVAVDTGSWGRIDEDLVELLGKLSGSGARLGLLSNIPADLAACHERYGSWLSLFEVRAFSCRIGHIKPEAAAFQWCLDALGADARQVLFVDDRAENVEAARELGMQGHVFTGRAGLEDALAKSE